ncbi:MAG: glutamate--cysteine ligase [Actinomycetota bacterium]|nr:glutamate--cysteine ligase [Actinomycetota bacterium]
MTAPTLGIEEEFLLVDARTGAVCDSGDRVVARAEERGDDSVEHEMRDAMVETGSAACADLAGAAREVRRRRQAVVAAARDAGARVLASGSHPTADPTTAPFAADDRYARIARDYGASAAAALVCGCHVHVSIPDRGTGVAVLDRIRPWLAVLLAVSANSPLWRGADTGHASWRRQVWDGWPAAGPTGVFGTLERYERLGRMLVATTAALDDGMLYYDARLSAKYPTVEVRVADVCLDPDDAVLVAALSRALVMTALAQLDAPPPDVPVEVLRGASWVASRHGIRGLLVDPDALEARPAREVLAGLRRHVAEALERTGDGDEVDDGLARVVRRGTGADAQRAAFARGGADAVLETVGLD